MSVIIRRLTDGQRYETARDFTPKTYRSTVTHKEKPLPRIAQIAIQGYLQGALLSICFTDNDYTKIRQIAYAAECMAEYDGRIPEDVNRYDEVFIPCQNMIRELQTEG